MVQAAIECADGLEITKIRELMRLIVEKEKFCLIDLLNAVHFTPNIKVDISYEQVQLNKEKSEKASKAAKWNPHDAVLIMNDLARVD